MKYPKILLIVTSGMLMTAHGVRMIYEGIKGENVYRPGTFDIIFDWTTLAIIGLIMFSWGLALFYSRYSQDQSKNLSISCPECGHIYDDDIRTTSTQCPRCRVSGEIDLSDFDPESVRKGTGNPL